MTATSKGSQTSSYSDGGGELSGQLCGHTDPCAKFIISEIVVF